MNDRPQQKLPESGPELKKLREAAHVSAAVVAKEVGMTPVSIWLFETGKTVKPRNLGAILAAYDKLDTLPKKGKGGEKPQKQKRGRPRKVQPKRHYTRQPQPEPEERGGEDDGLDEIMKSRRAKAAKPSPAPGTEIIDSNYLRVQLDAWKKNGVTTVTVGVPGQPEHAPRTFIIVTESQICEYGRLVALRCGKNLG